MKLVVTIFFSLLLSVGFFGQDVSREQKFQQIKDLNSQVNTLTAELLRPEASDLRDAESQGLKAFRLMPRETFSRLITVPQEGGSYYSFTTGSHEYQKIAQISLEQNYIRSGFAGADYGLMANLGDIGLSEVKPAIPEYAFLFAYPEPNNTADARTEQRKAYEFKTEAFTLRSSFPALVGNTYLLRAISFERADVLVALKIMKKDTDGSLIIFWKQLADFGKPTLQPKTASR